MNPYAKYLDGRHPVEIMRATPGELQDIVSKLSMEEIAQPIAPGKWSLREILAHLADCEVVWAWRIRQALETPGATVAPFDQDVWATRYAAYTADAAMTTFTALRVWNMQLIDTLTEQARGAILTHPERGTFSIAELFELIAGHDRNHLIRLHERFN